MVGSSAPDSTGLALDVCEFSSSVPMRAWKAALTAVDVSNGTDGGVGGSNGGGVIGGGDGGNAGG